MLQALEINCHFFYSGHWNLDLFCFSEVFRDPSPKNIVIVSKLVILIIGRKAGKLKIKEPDLKDGKKNPDAARIQK